MNVEKIKLEQLCRSNEHGEWLALFETGVRVDPDLDTTIIAAYAERMEEGDQFPPVVLFRDSEHLYVGDGFHRIAAAEKNGFTDIEADVREGTRLDAVWFALGANRQHGRRMSDADRKNAVARAMREFPNKSLREIAERIGCSHEYVRKIRDAATEVSTVDTCAKVTGRDGKAYPARREPSAGKSSKRPVFKTPEQEEAWYEKNAERKADQEDTPTTPATSGKKPGNAIRLAGEAIACMAKISRNDSLRDEAWRTMSDWLKANL